MNDPLTHFIVTVSAITAAAVICWFFRTFGFRFHRCADMFGLYFYRKIEPPHRPAGPTHRRLSRRRRPTVRAAPTRPASTENQEQSAAQSLRDPHVESTSERDAERRV